MLLFQIVEIGLAIAATDRVDVKHDVVGLVVVQHTQQVAAQLFARGATQPVATPDFAQRMHAGVAALDDFRQLRGQLWILAQSIFDRRHRFGGQCFVEIRGQVGFRCFRHRIEPRRR